MDFSCFLGTWPFHKLRRGSLDKLLRLHRENGFGGGYISALPAVFYNDPWEAELELADAIRTHPEYRQVMTVNPKLPGWRDDLARSEKLRIAAVRVFPSIHGYRLDDGDFQDLVHVLEVQGIPLFLTLRAEDERVSYLLRPNPVSMDDLAVFLQRPHTIPVLLSNVYLEELLRQRGSILRGKNILFDACGLKDGLFTLEELQRLELLPRMVYGSFAPLLCLESSLEVVTAGRIPEEQRRALLSGNAWIGVQTMAHIEDQTRAAPLR